MQAALRLNAKQTKTAKEVRQFLPRIVDTATNGEFLDKCIALETLGSLGAAAKGVLPQLQALIDQKPKPRSGPLPFDVNDMTPMQKREATERSHAQLIRLRVQEAIDAIKQDIDESN